MAAQCEQTMKFDRAKHTHTHIEAMISLAFEQIKTIRRMSASVCTVKGDEMAISKSIWCWFSISNFTKNNCIFAPKILHFTLYLLLKYLRTNRKLTHPISDNRIFCVSRVGLRDTKKGEEVSRMYTYCAQKQRDRERERAPKIAIEQMCSVCVDGFEWQNENKYTKSGIKLGVFALCTHKHKTTEPNRRNRERERDEGGVNSEHKIKMNRKRMWDAKCVILWHRRAPEIVHIHWDTAMQVWQLINAKNVCVALCHCATHLVYYRLAYRTLCGDYYRHTTASSTRIARQ